MRLSNSELLCLLQRALETSGWSNGRCEEAAYAIWWMHSRGMDWLDTLDRTWPRLSLSVAPTPELTDSHVANSIINAGGASLLYCGPNSIDLAFANAFSETLANVETRHVQDRIMVLPGLATLARRGASAVARWYRDNSLHIATIRAGSIHPTYIEYAVPLKERIKSSSLFLTCSLNEDGVNHFIRNLSKKTETHHVLKKLLPEQFEQCATNSLEHGLEVPDRSFDILNGAGNMLLVEDRKSVRMGTG